MADQIVYLMRDDDGECPAVVATRELADALAVANGWAWDDRVVISSEADARERFDLFPDPEDEGPDFIARPAGEVAEAVPFGECQRCQATTVRQVEGEYLCIGCQEAEGMPSDDPAQQPELATDEPEPPLEEPQEEERAW